MTSELSNNWKKLQVILKQESKKTTSQNKPGSTQRQRNSNAKRKRVESQQNKATTFIAGRHKRARMGIGTSSPEHLKELAPSTSLQLWAKDNDISARDLAEAYGAELGAASVQYTSGDSVNFGLCEDAEIGQYVAMDCEMVGVGGEEDRSVLARVSIVNFHGTQIYDSFVKPEELVTDWRTHVSGVSTKDMATARSFEEVRDAVETLLKDRVLVGHGIKHDLEVMMLGHPKKDMRDTARLQRFRKYSGGKTPSLKKLAKEILGVDIQGGQHSSIEDARVTMLLFRRHKQDFDADLLSRFPQRTTTSARGKTKSKRKKQEQTLNERQPHARTSQNLIFLREYLYSTARNEIYKLR